MCLARPIYETLPILLRAYVQMPNWHENVEGLLPFWSGSFVDPRRRVDIKRWYVRQGVLVEDLVERGLVIPAQKNVVMRDLWIFLVHAPVEHDCGTGVEFVFKLFCLFIFWKQLFVDIRKISVPHKDICNEFTPVFSNGRINPASLRQAQGTIFFFHLFYGRVVNKLYAQFLGNLYQSLNPCVHASPWIPDALSQLRILEQGIGRRCIVRA